MKSVHTLLSIVAVSVAGSAFAGGGPYPLPAVPTADSTVSRAAVVAELREAQRLSLVSVGEGDIPVATAEQEQMIFAAGRRAAEKERTLIADDSGVIESVAAATQPAGEVRSSPARRRWLL